MLELTDLELGLVIGTAGYVVVTGALYWLYIGARWLSTRWRRLFFVA